LKKSQHIRSQHVSPVSEAITMNDDDRWSSIPVSEELDILNLLSKECHSIKDLLKERHLLHTYTDEELEGLRQCCYCGGKVYLNPYIKPLSPTCNRA